MERQTQPLGISIQSKSGAEMLDSIAGRVMLAFGVVVMAGGIAVVGWQFAAILIVIPLLVVLITRIFKNPELALGLALVMGFLNSGLSRYLPMPWGLSIDIALFLGVVALFFQNFNQKHWKKEGRDLLIVSTLWFGYLCLELVNPEMKSAVAWFYAMRGIGFYQLLAVIIVLQRIRKPSVVNQFVLFIVWFSILGTLWGLRQKYMGTDTVEDHWLYAENHHEEHVLFGVLRVFSFYSDAGQFGASQAMMALLCGVMCLGVQRPSQKVFYAVAGVVTFIGFAISGTRGALAVPAAGGVIYLIMRRNFFVLLLGMAFAGGAFYVLKYTHLFHQIEAVRRMRTAMDPDNPSLNARLRNQAAYGKYLSSRPMGGGVGSAGYWGERFNPGSFMAETPTDSWYVKIWAETGVIGLALHLGMLGFIMGKGAHIVLHIRDKELRVQLLALYVSVGGILVSSYGNQIFGQMPTGIIMSAAIPLIFLGRLFDQQLTTEKTFINNDSNEQSRSKKEMATGLHRNH